MAGTLSFIERHTVIHCCNCGLAFSVPESYERRLRATHSVFYCPAGHPQGFYGKSDLEKARDELARTKHHLEQADARAAANRAEAERIARRLHATRGVVTRHKNRIARGKCPCCSKAFKDLTRHMETRHPKWNPEKEAEVRGG